MYLGVVAMLSWEGEDVWVSVCMGVSVDVWLSVPGGGGDVVLGRGRCMGECV